MKLYQVLTRQRGTERSLAGQILRSGTAIGANWDEAHAGPSKPDFISKCSIARKEAREARYWLRLLATCDAAHHEPLTELIAEAGELVAILTTIVKNAQASLPKT